MVYVCALRVFILLKIQLFYSRLWQFLKFLKPVMWNQPACDVCVRWTHTFELLLVREFRKLILFCCAGVSDCQRWSWNEYKWWLKQMQEWVSVAENKNPRAQEPVGRLAPPGDLKKAHVIVRRGSAPDLICKQASSPLTYARVCVCVFGQVPARLHEGEQKCTERERPYGTRHRIVPRHSLDPFDNVGRPPERRRQKRTSGSQRMRGFPMELQPISLRTSSFTSINTPAGAQVFSQNKFTTSVRNLTTPTWGYFALHPSLCPGLHHLFHSPLPHLYLSLLLLALSPRRLKSQYLRICCSSWTLQRA